MTGRAAQGSMATFVHPPMRLPRPACLAALLLPLLMAPALMAQQQGVKVENLPNFDLRKYHFGFLLSYNTSDFIMRLKPEAPFRDSIMVLDHIRRPGFNLGIVASLRLNKNLSLRFLPTLSFQERMLQYQFLQPDSSVKGWLKPVESTYLEFPPALQVPQRPHQQLRRVHAGRRQVQH